QNGRIRKVAGGIITTIAGAGTVGFLGDGGAATSAPLGSILGLAVDAAGAVYVADGDNNRIRRIASGVVSTYAGVSEQGFSGDGALATAARCYVPKGLAFDAAGNLYIVDSANHRVRRVDAASGIIGTVAGTGSLGFSGDGGPAVAAEFSFPSGIAL